MKKWLKNLFSRKLTIKLKRISNDAIEPTRATSYSNGYDFYSTESFTLHPGYRRLTPLGFAMELPKGFVGLVCPKSGKALKLGLSIANPPGVIDSDYREEVGVILYNENQLINDIKIKKGEKIAQLLVVKAEDVNFEWVEELSKTDRTGGFGSTGN